jgi:hypothetical protein
MYRTILRLCQTRSPLMSSNKRSIEERSVLASRAVGEALVEACISVFAT